jgi:hypothetical protein
MSGKREAMGKRWERMARKINTDSPIAHIGEDGKMRFMRTPNKHKDRSKYDANGNLKRVKYGEGRR